MGPNTRSTVVRVTIFLKAKIGTLVGEFTRDEIYGPFKLLFAKSGTLSCGTRLDSRSRVRDAQSEIKIGVISKKKKKKRRSTPSWLHDLCEFQAPERLISAAGHGLTFFFLEITPVFLYFFISTPCPLSSNLQPHLSVPLLKRN